MTTENTFTITIPLGVIDARAHVALDGTVTLGSHAGHPLPAPLASAAWAVLSSWMIEQDHSVSTGTTMIPMDGWRELFAHRLQPAEA